MRGLRSRPEPFAPRPHGRAEPSVSARAGLDRWRRRTRAIRAADRNRNAARAEDRHARGQAPRALTPALKIFSSPVRPADPPGRLKSAIRASGAKLPQFPPSAAPPPEMAAFTPPARQTPAALKAGSGSRLLTLPRAPAGRAAPSPALLRRKHGVFGRFRPAEAPPIGGKGRKTLPPSQPRRRS